MFRKLWNSLTNTNKRPADSRSRAAKKRRYCPVFDKLEDRTVPALDLDVIFSGGNLLIRDTDLLDAGATNASATVSFNAGQISVTGTGGTEINGVVNGTTSFFGVINILAQFGGGNDTLTVNGAGINLAGHLDVFGGLGNDTLNLNGNNVIGGRLSFNGGDGDNTFNFNAGQQSVLGPVNITNGAGRQSVNIANALVTDTAAVGSLFVTNGVNTSGLGNLFSVGGARFTSFGPVSYIEHFATTANTFASIQTLTPSSIGGDVFVATAGGVDSLDLMNVNMNGHLAFIGNGELDAFRFNGNNSVRGNVAFYGNDGNNLFQHSGGSLSILGSVDIRNLTGFQTVTFGTLVTDTVTIQGGVAITNGNNTTATNNTVTFGVAGGPVNGIRILGPVGYSDVGVHTANTNIVVNGETFFGSSIQYFLGGGNNLVDFNATTTVQGPFGVGTLGGNDEINYDSPVFFSSSVFANLGNGNNVVTGTDTTIHFGPVGYVTGVGNDFFNVAGDFSSFVNVSAGEGNNTVQLIGAFGASTVVTAGSGTDILNIGYEGFFGFVPPPSSFLNTAPLSANLGAGTNTVKIEDTTFGAAVSYFAFGTNVINIEKESTGNKSTFNGPVNITVAGSANVIDVGLDADLDDGLVVNALANIFGGLPGNQLIISNGGLRVAPVGGNVINVQPNLVNFTAT